MLYYFLKFILNITIRFYYKNIKLNGLELLPIDKPVLLASNHSSAFMDAIVMALLSKRKMHFLARSDVFNTPLKTWILSQFNIMPIYRIQEGADKLHRNAETFEKCHKLLNKNACIVIFPEGICLRDRKLQKLKKGLARIAFGSVEIGDYKLDLKIVPVGINYSKPNKHSGDLLINFGQPINVLDYLEEYKADKTKAIIRLTADTEAAMAREIIIIEKYEDETLMENLEELLGHHMNNGNYFSVNKTHQFKKDLAEKVNALTFDKELKETITNKSSSLFQRIKANKVLPAFINYENTQKNIAAKLFSKILLLTTLFPIFVIGAILNYIPYRISYIISKKTVRHIEFFASVNFTVGSFIFLIFYIILTIVIYTNFGITKAMIVLLLGPIFGLIAINYRSLFYELVGEWKVTTHREKFSGKLSQKIELLKLVQSFDAQKVKLSIIEKEINSEFKTKNA
jgi:glycerol-3-phosphate O-acyltransferase / dihydroxyacetone phosphate acyltransferase